MIFNLILAPWFVINAITDYKQRKMLDKVNLLFFLIAFLSLFFHPEFNFLFLLKRLGVSLIAGGLVLSLAMVLNQKMGGDIKASFVMFLGLDFKLALVTFITAHALILFQVLISHFRNRMITDFLNKKRYPLGVYFLVSFLLSFTIFFFFENKVNDAFSAFFSFPIQEIEDVNKTNDIESIVGKKLNSIYLFDDKGKEFKFDNNGKYIFIIADDTCLSCHELLEQFKTIKIKNYSTNIVQISNEKKFLEYEFEKYFINSNNPKAPIKNEEFKEFAFELWEKAIPFTIIIDKSTIKSARIGTFDIKETLSWLQESGVQFE